MINSYSIRPNFLDQFHRVWRDFLAQFDALQKLGLFSVFLYCVYWSLPGSVTSQLRVGYLTLNALYLFISALRGKLPLRLSPSVFLLLLIYFWGVFCSFYANLTLGREIEMGRVYWYAVEHAVPFFVASSLVSQNSLMRRHILGLLFITFSISCVVGILQFMRIPPFIALSRLYTYKAIDNWDSVGGLRAIGLTWHPRIFSIQAIFCLAIAVDRFVKSQGKSKYLVLMVMFSTCVIASQARQFIPALALLWIYVFIKLYRYNIRSAALMLIILFACAVVGILFAGKRLAYSFQSTTLSSDASYNYRAEHNWIQADNIVKQFPLTGIGPDKVMFLGPNSDFHDKWTDGKLMESAYRVFVAMYGLPGLVLLLVFFAALVWQASVSLRSKDDDVTSASIALLFTAISISVSCYASNVFDEYQSIPLLMLISGLLMNHSGVFGRLSFRKKPTLYGSTALIRK